MNTYESFAFRPQPDEAINTSPQWHLELNHLAQQRRNPASIVERSADQVKDQVKDQVTQGVTQTVRETQASIRATRERAEIAGTLVANFDAIDGSNRAHSRDGKITRDEILNYRRDHATSLTTNELRNLQIAARDFGPQLGRGKDWANKADIETYKISPPVAVRRPAPRKEEEGIDDKIKDKAKGIWNGIRRRVGD